MPDINTGLTEGDAPPPEVDLDDPNSQEGFEAALARSVAGDEPDTSREPGVTPAVADGLEQPGGEPAPERDPETGRFVARTPQPTGGEEPQAAAPAEDGGEKLLAGKYKSVEELERAYAEAQSLIGRKDAEMNDRLARLEAQLRESQEEPAAIPTMTEEDVNGIAEMIATHGGQRTLAWLAENRDDLLDEGIRQWIIEDPAEAIPVATRYHTIRAQQELGARQPALPEPLVRQVETEQLREAMARVASDTPDWAEVGPYIETALADHPMSRDLSMMLKSGNPASQEAALRFLHPAAKIKSLEAKAAGATPVETPKQKAARETAARSGALVTGSQRAASPAAATATESEESAARVAAFKESFKETPTTDIGAGLTFGNRA